MHLGLGVRASKTFIGRIVSNHKDRGKNEARLTHARLLELVGYDKHTGRFSGKVFRFGVKNGDHLGHVESTTGHRRICIDGKRFLAHRLAWFYVNGVWPSHDIDHRDLEPDNNRWSNLREATCSNNHHNTRQPGSGHNAPYKGAHWNRFRGYWQSYIKINGKSHYLGRFETPLAAHRAYAAAAKRLVGQFARAV